ncbi:MAG: hypothetical protein QM778_23030 [Myxococcales bacterium]
MPNTVTIDLSEVRKVFDFLERAHDLLHQPEKYSDPRVVEKFAAENYEELRRLYYEVVWHWLPKDVQREIEER